VTTVGAVRPSVGHYGLRRQATDRWLLAGRCGTVARVRRCRCALVLDPERDRRREARRTFGGHVRQRLRSRTEGGVELLRTKLLPRQMKLGRGTFVGEAGAPPLPVRRGHQPRIVGPVPLDQGIFSPRCRSASPNARAKGPRRSGVGRGRVGERAVGSHARIPSHSARMKHGQSGTRAYRAVRSSSQQRAEERPVQNRPLVLPQVRMTGSVEPLVESSRCKTLWRLSPK
jgi:hypothetical protein